MPRIKSILAFAAISAATAASATAAISAATATPATKLAGAAPTAEYGLPWCSIPKADRIAAGLAATHTSAPLYQFALIHVRFIPRNTTCPVTKK